MRKFSVVQVFDAPSDLVVERFRSEESWRSFRGLPFVGDPSLTSYRSGEPVEVAMSYRVSIELPTLAEGFIDVRKLTFVEVTRLHRDGSGAFEILPDHYASLVRSSGTTEVVAVAPARCERIVSGAVDVTLGWSGKLFESPVEDAIVNGLSKALVAQAAQLRLD